MYSQHSNLKGKKKEKKKRKKEFFLLFLHSLLFPGNGHLVCPLWVCMYGSTEVGATKQTPIPSQQIFNHALTQAHFLFDTSTNPNQIFTRMCCGALIKAQSSHEDLVVWKEIECTQTNKSLIIQRS